MRPTVRLNVSIPYTQNSLLVKSFSQLVEDVVLSWIVSSVGSLWSSGGDLGLDPILSHSLHLGFDPLCIALSAFHFISLSFIGFVSLFFLPIVLVV